MAQSGGGGGGRPHSPFDSMHGSKLQYIAPVSILYGGYVSLYILCLYVLLSRRRQGYVWQLASATTLFILATLSIVTVLILANDATVSSHAQPEPWLLVMTVTVPIISYIVADCILIHRCYLIWDSNWKVIVLPILLLLASITVGFITPQVKSLMALFFSLTLGTNVLVTCLSAGRIVFVAKTGSNYLRQDVKQKYIIAINLILESGLFYCAALTSGVVFGILKSSNQGNMVVGFFETFIVSTQLSGILPTLLIVWVGLRRNMRDDEYLGDMRPLYDATDARPLSIGSASNVAFDQYLPSAKIIQHSRSSSFGIANTGLNPSLKHPGATVGRGGRGNVSGWNRDIEKGIIDIR